MTEKTKNILSLNHTEAMDFFLKSEQYHGFELPEYFVFDDLLQNVKNAVAKRPMRRACKMACRQSSYQM